VPEKAYGISSSFFTDWINPSISSETSSIHVPEKAGGICGSSFIGGSESEENDLVAK
jgi:hypothetical protein